MAAVEDRDLVARVEGLLEELEGLEDRVAREQATEVVAALLDLYGEGLGRIVERVAERDDGSLAEALAEDELVSHLLLLHGLHPVPVEDRVRTALDEVRPYLESHGGNVELLSVADGIARLRLEGSCSGCPSSTMTLKLAIENAIAKSAPDIETVEAEGAVEAAPAASPLIQLEGLDAPSAGANGAEPSAAGEDGWTMAGGMPELAAGRGDAPVIKDVSGERLLFVALAGSTYAYRPGCPACGDPLGDATLERTDLDLPRLRQPLRRHAGRALPGRAAASPRAGAAAGRRRRTGQGGAGGRRLMPMAAGGRPIASSRLAGLAQRSREAEREAEEERCELCGVEIPPEHRHVLDLETGELRCTCRACSLLFDRPAAAQGNLRLVGDRHLRLVDFELSDLAWEELRIPVEMAFFFRSSRRERVVAFYPEPDGRDRVAARARRVDSARGATTRFSSSSSPTSRRCSSTGPAGRASTTWCRSTSATRSSA